ncbi:MULTISPECIES: efflux transporter outer membrane subunit [unclassified Duganella]|uniref:efflux transporter outer membrane subunit n=1 Tax=unclassified Duganella TaxID=2636909 RepID=UPI0008925C85|nr:MULTISPECIES: efflux transporter outer membrane subunit [unclassified Duganella]SDF64024.1 efflux transporter, outer membrane factor (OMF) lipoprotein, NodT family [Duganella sp. OV458]SDI64487.1 efflux transporter, outer membrane factor (OMF) lipoprotein, NodT family [Duganella sp. OV510]
MTNSIKLAISVVLIATAPARAQGPHFDDPQLLRLIQAAVSVSATLAEADARIADARAASVASDGALLPTLGLNASAERGISTPGTPVAGNVSIGLQASWEVDLFGALRAGASAAQARLAASEAALHGVRVAVAAEVASSYVDLRACEAQLAYAVFDAESRAETARLTALAADGGMRAPASADLADASAAQGRAVLSQQGEQCGLALKSLAALTAISETALRNELAGATAHVPQASVADVDTVPAGALSQRPDLLVAAQALIAASADYQQAQGQQWPRITLNGNISAARASSAGLGTNGPIWTVGPVSFTLPLFDAGVRRANMQAALARYQAAGVSYAERLRNAVRDTESALLSLKKASGRRADTDNAVNGFERSYRAADALYRGGLASLFELEDARRSMLAAHTSLVDQQRDSAIAWISLYRATGGWTPAHPQKQDTQ